MIVQISELFFKPPNYLASIFLKRQKKFQMHPLQHPVTRGVTETVQKTVQFCTTRYGFCTTPKIIKTRIAIELCDYF